IRRRERSTGGSGNGGRMNRRQFIGSGLAAGVRLPLQNEGLPPLPSGPVADRAYWVQVLRRIADPVLDAARQRKLRQLMPVEALPGKVDDRRQFTHLEALGRLLCGIAPWLESGAEAGDEGQLRSLFASWSRDAIGSATDTS